MKFLLTISLLIIYSMAFSQDRFDSMWELKGHKFEMHLKRDDQLKQDINAKIIILKDNKIILADSLACNSWLNIVSNDMNGDGYKDILVYEGAGARSNKRFNLFVYMQGTNEFKKVPGFNLWPNMIKTEIKGIVYSIILTGTVEYSFFKLQNSGKLIDLKISEIDKTLAGNGYERGLKKVKQKLTKH